VGSCWELLDHIMQQKGAKATGTVNRYLATMRSILHKAHREWGWLDMVPTIRMRDDPKQRIRWITRAEAAQLLAALPSHLADAAELTLNTGFASAMCCHSPGDRSTWRDIRIGSIPTGYSDPARLAGLTGMALSFVTPRGGVPDADLVGPWPKQSAA
ncbi:MAG: hypothetical protein WA970_18485, partial [Gammaproteobacteria bacterium]